MLKKTSLSSGSTRNARRLALARESIRNLSPDQFVHVAGGEVATPSRGCVQTISDIETVCSGQSDCC